ncbi:MAG: glycosyltransferase [Clostridiales bacterium]|nr:glycosyltransferase [Clostridiales bacterium]
MKKRGLYDRFFKRFFDFMISLVAVLILSPFILVIYVLSAIILRGNPIFKQYRPGKDNKLFPLYKFRSMTNKKDKDGNLLPDKDRITGWGKFLRKTSLDELPQLFNILFGQMSIVGPRPRLIKDQVFYSEEVLAANTVRPGLTGPAQVYDRNSESSWESVFERDIEYANNVTLLGDIKLFIGTFTAVLKGGSSSGAEENAEKREYYYADHLLKADLITKEQYDEGLKIAKTMEEEKQGVITYNKDLHKEVIEEPLPEGEADISVLMSVYKNDKPEWLIVSVESIINQTLKPREIVLYVDGPVGDELDKTIIELCKKYPIISLHRNEENIGLGKTLEKGLLDCKYDIVARMDSDDYSIPTRFAQEYKALLDNELDLVGSNVSEFIGDIDNIVAEKHVPSKMKDIVKYAKSRSPFNHPTVMFRKAKVLEAGNYQEMRLCEDYYLWVRLLQIGAKVGNINKSLVLMRVSEDLYARRGGLAYYKSQKNLLKYMRKTKFIGFITYTKSKMIRFTVQVLMPNKLRQRLYMKMLRKG